MSAPNYPIHDVLPHDTPMVLLDRIERRWDGGIETAVTIRDDSLFCDAQGVPAWVGIEYMGQAIAAYAGAQARDRDESVKIGFLVGSRRYSASSGHFPRGETLLVSAEQITDETVGLQVFECRITGPSCSAEARLNVFMPQDVDAFLQGTAQ